MWLDKADVDKANQKMLIHNTMVSWDVCGVSAQLHICRLYTWSQPDDLQYSGGSPDGDGCDTLLIGLWKWKNTVLYFLISFHMNKNIWAKFLNSGNFFTLSDRSDETLHSGPWKREKLCLQTEKHVDMTDSQPAVRPSNIRTGKRQISEFCFRCLWNMAVRSLWLVDVWFQAWWQNPERPSLMWWRKHQNHDWSPPRIRRRRRWGGHCMMMRCWPLKLNRAAGLWGRSFRKRALITTETRSALQQRPTPVFLGRH